MKIANHRLVAGDGENVSFVPTPNQSSGIKPLYLVIHYTAGATATGAVSWFQKPEAKASAHLVIDRDGSVVQLVPFNRRAWHAGDSRWGNLEQMNQYAIGIELVNCGKLVRKESSWMNWSKKIVPEAEVVLATHKDEATPSGWHDYTSEQVDRTTEVAALLHADYNFTDILGHDDISPHRKTDPGPLFPMNSLRSVVLGRE